MLYILLIIYMLIAIIGYFHSDRYGDHPLLITGTIFGVFCLAALLIVWGVYYYDKNTIDARLEVLEEQNELVLSQIEPIVQKALDYESGTYKELKLSADKIIAIGNMYPDLKDNSFLQAQLDIVVSNQSVIRDLKLTKAKMNAYRFWIFTKTIE